MKIKNGCTRKVFLIGMYAFKIPQTDHTWKLFLQGLMCNMQESEFGKMGDDRMAPVLWASWGGWLIIMPRCELITVSEFHKLDIEKYHPNGASEACYNGIFNVPVEFKHDSFGWYKKNGVNNKIVAIDYGS